MAEKLGNHITDINPGASLTNIFTRILK